MTLDFAISLERFTARPSVGIDGHEHGSINSKGHQNLDMPGRSMTSGAARSRVVRTKHRRQKSLPHAASNYLPVSPRGLVRNGNSEQQTAMSTRPSFRPRKRSNSSEDLSSIEMISPGPFVSQLSPTGRQSPRQDMRKRLDLDRRLLDYGLAVQQMQTDISRTLQEDNEMTLEIRRQQEHYMRNGLQAMHQAGTKMHFL